MFKGLGNLAGLMRSASELTGKMDEFSKKLAAQTVVGSAGGGLVTVEMNGLTQVTQVTIDPMLLENKEVEMLQTLLPAAINQAITKAKQLHMEGMKDLTGGIEIPGLQKMFDQMGGGSGEPPEKET